MTNPLFSDNGDEQNTDPQDDSIDLAAELIGEGKRYKTAQDAAKALLEKDKFIERLKAENAEARASLRGEQRMDEFLEKLKAVTSGNASTQNTMSGETATNQNHNTNNNSPKALTAEEVQEMLDKREREKQEAANLALAAQKVREAFGANHTAILQQKAAELGMTPEYLTNLAKAQPKAFLKLVEADQPVAGRVPPPTTSLNTNALATQKRGGERDQKYYSALRKQIGDAEFFKPQIQNQLHKDAERLKEAFFN